MKAPRIVKLNVRLVRLALAFSKNEWLLSFDSGVIPYVVTGSRMYVASERLIVAKWWRSSAFKRSKHSRPNLEFTEAAAQGLPKN